MSELLTSLDIVNQAFKKTMRGYDPGEVDEFLDRVAECTQVYVQKIKDYERVIAEQSEKLRDYDNIKGSLHEALLMAQRTADEKITNAGMLADEKVAQAGRVSDEKIGQATMTAENLIAEARAKAERIIRDAETSVQDMARELTRLQELRASGFASLHAFISDMSGVLDKAESTGKIQMPTMTLNLMSRSGARQGQSAPIIAASPPRSHEGARTAGRPSAHTASSSPQDRGKNHASPPDTLSDHASPEMLTPEQRQAQLANTLTVLGIDLSLLNTNPVQDSEE